MKQDNNSKWVFKGQGEEFHFEMSLNNRIAKFYYPLCNERYHASVTPYLAGDSSLDINSYLLKPITEEELTSSNYSRNLWIKFGDKVWSATGNSLLQKMHQDEDVTVRGGLLWHEVERINENLGIKSKVLNFVPATNDAVELMRVTIENLSEEPKEIVPTVAIPIYARSADNIRDHHHVTSLLNRVEKTEKGVVVEPTLSFDERGHVKNHLLYQVYAADQDQNIPSAINPVMDDFIGNGTLDWPQAVTNGEFPSDHNPIDLHGRHTIASMRFDVRRLSKGESTTFYIVMGIDSQKIDPTEFLTPSEFEKLLEGTKVYWQKKISSITFKSGDHFFDQWLDWVTLQPILRRIYGNSYLPHHDYGRGGRGWRDLWQDILSLILIENKEVRDLLISNFAGVRMDGSNATIIGNSPGEFKADRNNIPRVWMDHGAWPLYTTYFYINQTGDLDILLEEQSYFNDQFSHRCRKVDRSFKESIGTRLKTSDNKVHFATIFEHLLVQNLTSCFNVGVNNNILLEGGDWNDALDMAWDYGESVAFTSFYANNLKVLVELLGLIKQEKGTETIELTEELVILIDQDIDLENPNTRKLLLKEYFSMVAGDISGEFKVIQIDDLIAYLDRIAEYIIDHLNSNEIIESDTGYSWYNGYYDNFGDRVEGDHEMGVRMTLTGQAFPLLSKIVEEEKIDDIIKSVDHFLFDEEIGGPRLNTDFKEVKVNLGRAFGFAYGHKENGAMFSHMAIMYTYGLYHNSRPHEGYKIINTLYSHLKETDKSDIYPNLPEYINQQGRGMYSYLTGSASWLIYLMVTQVYGVRGNIGDLVLEPKLIQSQFDDGLASITTTFRNIELEVVYHNPDFKDYGEYSITKVVMGDSETTYSDSMVILSFEDLKTYVDQTDSNHITLEIHLQ